MWRVRSVLQRVTTTGALGVVAAATLVAATAAPAGATPGTITFGNGGALATSASGGAIDLVQPLTVTGTITNSDTSASPSPLNAQLALSDDGPGTWSVSSSMFQQATCDVDIAGGTPVTGQTVSAPAAQQGSDTATLVCDYGFQLDSTGNPGSSADVVFHLAFSGPAEAVGHTLSATMSVAGTDDLTPPSSSTTTLNVVQSPSVTANNVPTTIGDTAKTFTVTVDNSQSAPQSAARLTALIQDASGGVPTLAVTKFDLECALGAPPQPVTVATDPAISEDSGSCPDNALAGDVATYNFSLGFTGTTNSDTENIKVQFVLDFVDSGGTPVAPQLAQTAEAPIAVFPPPTLQVNGTPAVIATGSAPRGFTAQVQSDPASHTYSNVRMQLAFSGITGLSSSQIYASCDSGGSSASLNGTTVVTGTCPLASSTLNPGDTPVESLQLCINVGAPTGTLLMHDELVDHDNNDAVIATDPTTHPFNVVAGTGASGSSCRDGGQTLIWNGPTGGDWNTSGNWDGNTRRVPIAGDTVIVPPQSSIANVGGQVQALVVDGGDSTHATSLALGSKLEVLTDTTLTGFSAWTGASLQPDAKLTTGSSADVSFDGTTVVLPATSAQQFGAGTKLHRIGAPTLGAPVFDAAGLFRPGTVTLDQIGLTLEPGASVDLAGGTLTLKGPSTSTFPAGTAVTGSGGGVLELANGALLHVTGTTTLTNQAHLQMDSGSTLDGGAGLTLTTPDIGQGTFDWRGGVVQGAVTLAAAMTTTGTGSSGQQIAAGSTVTNLGKMVLNAPPGTFDVEGVLDNAGTVTVAPGVTIFGTSSNSQPRFINEAGASLTLTSASSSTVPATFSGIQLVNSGTISVPISGAIRVRDGSATLNDGSNITGGGTPSSSNTSATAGVLGIGSNASVVVAGTVTLQKDAVLALDDTGTVANPPTLTTSGAGKLVASTSATTTDGGFHWCIGRVAGSLTVDANLATEIGPATTAGSCKVGNTVSVTLGGGSDPSNLVMLRSDGPGTVNNATVTAEPHSRLVLDGKSTIGMVTRLQPSGGAVDDQALVVGSTGSVDVPGLAQAPGISASTQLTIDIPLDNSGTFSNEAAVTATSALTNRGNFDVSKTFTATGSMLNTGSVFVFSTTLNPRGGYTQELPAGAGSSTPNPVTRFNDASSILTTADGASPANYAPVTITNGVVAGGGTINASGVSVAKGVLRPSFAFGTATTMTINAPLQLSTASDTQVVVYKSDSHDVIKVTQPVKVSGRITGFTSSTYTPAYLATIRSVMTFPSHSGDFTDSAWGGTPTGLGWKAIPLTSTAKQVDLQLVDVAPPSLGIASIPAFTEFGSQRVTYAAVDNKTGVKSYDVRWRSGDPSHAFSSWHYPTAWQRTQATYVTKTGLAAGWEYCFSLRARDGVGNITPWSVPLCTTRMLDDHALAARGSWTRPTGKTGFYVKTYSKTTRLGAYLTRAPGTFARVGVIAYACPKCGVVGIYSGKTLLKKWSLRSSRTRLANWISPVLSSRYARLTIRSLTRGKDVVIDAVGLMR